MGRPSWRRHNVLAVLLAVHNGVLAEDLPQRAVGMRLTADGWGDRPPQVRLHHSLHAVAHPSRHRGGEGELDVYQRDGDGRQVMRAPRFRPRFWSEPAEQKRRAREVPNVDGERHLLVTVSLPQQDADVARASARQRDLVLQLGQGLAQHARGDLVGLLLAQLLDAAEHLAFL